MELKHYIHLLWTWKWLILISMLLAGGTAFGVSQRITPVYESSTTLRINQAPSSTGAVDYQSLMTSERLSKTYAEMLKNRPILQATIAKLGLDTTYKDLAGNMTVTAIRDTQLIALTVQDTDPQRAANIANEIVTAFIQQEQQVQSSRYAASRENLGQQLTAIEQDIQTTQENILRLGKKTQRTITEQAEYDQMQSMLAQYRTNYTSVLQSLEEVRLAEAQSTNNLIVVEPAIIVPTPVAPRPMTNTLLATIVGAMWAVMVVFLKEYLDDTIRSSDEVEYLTNMPVLASIGQITNAKGDEKDVPQKLITIKQGKSPIAEAYRVLRANIDFSIVDRSLRTLLVTSSGPKEGKSTTAANLAAAIAHTGRTVVLVDTDLRRPMVHTFFGMSNEQGITMALVQEEPPIATYIQPTEIEHLSILPSGPIPPNPAELLGSQRMAQVVETLQGMFDVIIFDSPPVLAVVDANLLARFCDATLMIVLAASTRASALVRAKEQLEQAGARLVGTVLNQVKKGRGGYYDYHYHYYYSSGSGGGKGGGKGKGELVPVMYSRNGHGDAKSLERVE